MESLFQKQFTIFQKSGSILSKKKEDYERERNNRDQIHLDKIKSTLDDLNVKYDKQISKLESTVKYYTTQIENTNDIVDAKKSSIQHILDEKIEVLDSKKMFLKKELENKLEELENKKAIIQREIDDKQEILDSKIEALTSKYETLIEECNKDSYLKECKQYIDNFNERINSLEEECQKKKDVFLERSISKVELDLKVEISNLEAKREKERDEMDRLEAEEELERMNRRKQEERKMALEREEKNRRKPKELQNDYHIYNDPRINTTIYDDPNYNPNNELIAINNENNHTIVEPIMNETVLFNFASVIEVGETKKDEKERQKRDIFNKTYKEYVLDLHALIKKKYPEYGDYFEAIIMPDRSVLLRFLDNDCSSLVGEEIYDTRKDFLKKYPLLENDLTNYDKDFHDLNLPKIDKTEK